MPVKNFFILQLELKMKKSKRYIKKQNNKPLINKKVLAKVIRESNICKHAIKELKLAGYGNSGGSAPWEECSCLKGIRLEDVTEELEDKAYEEMRHN